MHDFLSDVQSAFTTQVGGQGFAAMDARRLALKPKCVFAFFVLGWLSYFTLTFLKTSQLLRGKGQVDSIIRSLAALDVHDQQLRRGRTPSTEELPKDSLSELLEGSNDSIFFTETDPGLEAFPGQKLCAYESAARFNPARKVVVISDLDSSASAPKALTSALPNLRFLRLNYSELITSSELSGFWFGHNISSRVHPYYRNQLSDVVRLLLLDRFGGAYLDADTASRAPVPTDIKNFILQDITYEINGAVMQFESGNPFLQFVVQELTKGEINYMSRNDVGPLHLSNCRKKFCPEPNKRTQDSRVLYTCPNFTVLKRDQGHMFDTREYVRIRTGQLAKLKEGSSSAFVIHYFGSNLGKLKMTQNHPLYSLIRETCPMADKVMQEEFAKAKKT